MVKTSFISDIAYQEPRQIRGPVEDRNYSKGLNSKVNQRPGVNPTRFGKQEAIRSVINVL
jgi:hypothetical protein